ncbi:MAG TPA: DUF2279 domain-containing protein [Polyangiaceae bacterium]
MLPPPPITSAEAAPAPDLVPPPPTPETVPFAKSGDEGFPWKQVGSAAIVGSIYVTAWTWVSAAWWSRKSDSVGFTILNEGSFGIDTYAGGSDKLGHYYAAYLMNRGFAGIFEWGGFPRTGSIVAATAMTTTFLTAVEFKDAYHLKYGWSWADIVANSSGQATALALMLIPELDRAVSVKIMYFPSADFFHALSTEGPLNTPEDYSGQTYLFSYHLASLPFVNREKSLRALRYVDLSVGYGTRGYKPVPEPPTPVRQELSFGFSVNLQSAFDDLLWPEHGTPSTGVQVVHFVNEVYQVPYTRVPFLTLTRTGPATEEGRN